jgi:hypothetical protein
MLILLGLGVLIAGCSVTTEREQMLDLPPDLRRIAVDVDNFRGDVVVKRDPTLRDTAWIKGYVSVPADQDKAQREAYRDAVTLSSGIAEASDGLGVVRIDASSTLTDDPEHRVRIEVVTPRLDGVRIANSGGAVEVIDPTGAIDIRNDGGGVLVRTSRPLTSNVLVLNQNGNIFVQAPTGTTGDLTIESLDGEAALNDLLGEARGKVVAGPDRIDATLGRGGNEIDLRTTAGVARFTLMERPLDFTRAVKATAPDPRDWLFLDSKRRHTRNLPDDAVLPLDRSGYGTGGFDLRQLREARGIRSNVDR